MRKVWINKGYVAKKTTTFVGGLYALLGFVGSFASLDEIFSDKLSIWIRIALSLGILAGVWIICFLVTGAVVTRKKRFEVISANNGHKLYVQYGDLFDECEVIKPNERRNIVVPVNRCFDTIVDNHLISETSVHGIAFQKLYQANKYTEESLNSAIQQLLVGKKYETLSEEEKPRGNRKRYPVGTVVDLPSNEKEHFILWSLSAFDSDLKARTSMQEYALAVQKLIEACNTESEGFPVVLPLVGTGLSRTKKGQQDVLSYLISAFELNKCEINCDIHIVVRDEIKCDVSIMGIK